MYIGLDLSNDSEQSRHICFDQGVRLHRFATMMAHPLVLSEGGNGSTLFCLFFQRSLLARGVLESRARDSNAFNIVYFESFETVEDHEPPLPRSLYTRYGQDSVAM